MALHLVTGETPSVSTPPCLVFSEVGGSSTVGQRRDHLSDDEREQAIAGCGAQVLAWFAEYERTGCFSHRGVADFWQRQMAELIRGRSPEKVRSMEVRRGIYA